MDSGWWALAVGAFGALVGWMFRSPKEQSDDLRNDLRETEQRVATLEGTLNALSRDYAGIHGRHDQALTTLTTAITRLTDRFDQYMGTVNGHTRGR